MGNTFIIMLWLAFILGEASYFGAKVRAVSRDPEEASGPGAEDRPQHQPLLFHQDPDEPRYRCRRGPSCYGSSVSISRFCGGSWPFF